MHTTHVDGVGLEATCMSGTHTDQSALRTWKRRSPACVFAFVLDHVYAPCSVFVCRHERPGPAHWASPATPSLDSLRQTTLVQLQ